MTRTGSGIHRRGVAAAGLTLAVLAVDACTAKEKTATGESATAYSSAGATSAPMTAAVPDTTPRAANAGIARWTDDNIVAKLEAGDSKEVELSRQVEPKLTDAGVKEYARMLAEDHGRSRNEVREVARKAKIAMKSPAGDTSRKELADLKTKFRDMPKGAAFDTAFVNMAVTDHVRDIADHRAMQEQAKSKELKEEIGKGIPVLQKHLDRARELARKLGGTNG